MAIAVKVLGVSSFYSSPTMMPLISDCGLRSMATYTRRDILGKASL